MEIFEYESYYWQKLNPLSVIDSEVVSWEKWWNSISFIDVWKETEILSL